MPYQKNGVRQYKRELNWEHSQKPNRVKDRAQRNKARKMVADKKGVAPTEIKGDVGHKKAISKGGLSEMYNLQVQSQSANRSFSRTKTGAMKSEQSKRERKSSKR